MSPRPAPIRVASLLVATAVAGAASADAVLIDENTCFAFPDNSCASMTVDSAVGGIDMAGLFDTGNFLNVPLTSFNADSLDPAVQDVLDAASEFGAFRVAATPAVYEAELMTRSSLQPTTATPLESQVFNQVQVVSTFLVVGDSFLVDIGIDLRIDGELDRPTDPAPGQIDVSHTWSAEGMVNNNPVTTPIFSASIGYSNLDAAPSASGTSALGIDFTDADGDGMTDDYLSTDALFPTLQFQVGQPITIRGVMTTNIFGQGYTSSDGTAWEHRSIDSSTLRLTLPPGFSIVLVPEPGSATLFVVGTACCGRRLRRR